MAEKATGDLVLDVLEQLEDDLVVEDKLVVEEEAAEVVEKIVVVALLVDGVQLSKWGANVCEAAPFQRELETEVPLLLLVPLALALAVTLQIKILGICRN